MTLYVPDADLMIYHIPKTGGMWVRQALRAWGIKATECRAPGVSTQHATPSHFPDHTGPRIVVVREPVSWYSSWYRYQTWKGWPVWEEGVWHPCRSVEANPESVGFADWVFGVTRGHSPLTDIYEAYLGPLTPVPRLDHGILPFESLESSLREALHFLDIETKAVHVPPVNVTPPMDEEVNHGALVRAMTHLAESRIYEQFGTFWEDM